MKYRVIEPIKYGYHHYAPGALVEIEDEKLAQQMIDARLIELVRESDAERAAREKAEREEAERIAREQEQISSHSGQSYSGGKKSTGKK